MLVRSNTSLFQHQGFIPAAFHLHFLRLLTSSIVTRISALITSGSQKTNGRLTRFILTLTTRKTVRRLTIILTITNVDRSVSPVNDFGRGVGTVINVFGPAEQPGISATDVTRP